MADARGDEPARDDADARLRTRQRVAYVVVAAALVALLAASVWVAMSPRRHPGALQNAERGVATAVVPWPGSFDSLWRLDDGPLVEWDAPGTSISIALWSNRCSGPFPKHLEPDLERGELLVVLGGPDDDRVCPAIAETLQFFVDVPADLQHRDLVVRVQTPGAARETVANLPLP